MRRNGVLKRVDNLKDRITMNDFPIEVKYDEYKPVLRAETSATVPITKSF